MKISELIKNDMTLDDDGVWVLRDHEKFAYSDGAASEKYLQKVFNRAIDLSSKSFELESYIKDWPSEYHLTRKRAQLLSGFQFDPKMNVLEVGCGCGAITRFLGENFDQVVSIEGSRSRARLAKLRTKDLDNVSIICAPFQDIKFSNKFDIIFCIGVFEYSGAFVAGDDPYDEALRCFKEMLNPNGVLVIAIENQFGLKYFSCAREDHIGTMFEGVEGYHRRPPKVRTFGKGELQTRLQRYFENVDFYYPYPDYKLPECVLSASFVESGRAGELISQMKARDYSGPMHRYWNEATTTLELDRNGMLPFFANSFILFASTQVNELIKFPQVGVFYSSGRKAEASTYTRILGERTGELKVVKMLTSGKEKADLGSLTIQKHENNWINSFSLQTELSLLALRKDKRIEDIFICCRPWIEMLMCDARRKNEQLMIDGIYIDSIWRNSYIVGGKCQFIDHEYVWDQDIPLNVIVVRAIYYFILSINDDCEIASDLKDRSGKRLIKKISNFFKIYLTENDFEEFIFLESQLQNKIRDESIGLNVAYIKTFLADRYIWRDVINLKNKCDFVLRKLSLYGVSAAKKIFSFGWLFAFKNKNI